MTSARELAEATRAERDAAVDEAVRRYAIGDEDTDLLGALDDLRAAGARWALEQTAICGGVITSAIDESTIGKPVCEVNAGSSESKYLCKSHRLLSELGGGSAAN